MKKLICLVLLLTGCATFNFRIVGWYNEDTEVLTSNGTFVRIIGNPRITCFTKAGTKLADGIFVTVHDNDLIVDEWGKDYVHVKNDGNNYCKLWEQK